MLNKSNILIIIIVLLLLYITFGKKCSCQGPCLSHCYKNQM